MEPITSFQKMHSLGDISHNTASVALTFHAGKIMLNDSIDIKKYS